jgi:hypothetical protein
MRFFVIGLALLFFVRPSFTDPRLVPVLLDLESCAPETRAFVAANSPLMFVVDNDASYAEPFGIMLFASHELTPKHDAMLTLAHESFHNWQFHQPEWFLDMLLYKFDSRARFRVELAANENPYIQAVRDNCP